MSRILAARPGLLALFTVATLAAQPQFTARVDLVTVPVSVVSRDPARPPIELSAGDFRIFEDGIRQDITVVSHEPQAISLCILLDSSPSMASGRQRLATRTIDALIEGLRPDDEAALVFFAARPRTVFAWTKAEALEPVSWLQWRPALGSALIDAMKEGLTLIEDARNPRHVIVIVSDGGENASRTPLASLIATRRQSETLVYGIDTELPPSRFALPVNRAFTNVLPALIGDSGGTVFGVNSPEAGEVAARALLDELRSQYTLGYVPRRATDGTFRQLKVELTVAGYTVRHRAGYLAK
jgi:Ca-activated chloride channel family protein